MGGLGFTGWYRLTGMTTSTFYIAGNVLNTNKCEISICETRIKNKFVIFCAIDNLVKGASGQAIQNMNLLFKFSENLGLK